MGNVFQKCHRSKWNCYHLRVFLCTYSAVKILGPPHVQIMPLGLVRPQQCSYIPRGCYFAIGRYWQMFRQSINKLYVTRLWSAISMIVKYNSDLWMDINVAYTNRLIYNSFFWSMCTLYWTVSEKREYLLKLFYLISHWEVFLIHTQVVWGNKVILRLVRLDVVLILYAVTYSVYAGGNLAVTFISLFIRYLSCACTSHENKRKVVFRIQPMFTVTV